MIKQLLLASILLLSSCVYTIDIQQGNILEQKDIDKLRPELTKNQVAFVLGNSVISDSFSDDKWIYLFTYKSEVKSKNKVQKLILYFEKDKLISAEGDFNIPKDLQTSKDL